MEGLYDVAVIGGGPAGSTAGALLAMHGRRVVVLERTAELMRRFAGGRLVLRASGAPLPAALADAVVG